MSHWRQIVSHLGTLESDGVEWDWSFDHLVGAREQPGRDRQSKCLRRYQIHDQFKAGRLLDRDIGRLRPAQNVSTISAKRRGRAGSSNVIRERPVRWAMPFPDYATEDGRSIRATQPPSRTRRKIRYHSSTIRDHIEAPTRGPEHVITNSKNRFH